ncbi:hypothetical protein FSP39_013243 [Pinctada imbricata]|uniref:G-protein coupled receptors family 1 profile domain-containing protein n=1 Tax=Pinctada imbricata TaxID=66713 RepID=A0AA89BQU2_PINIB|nr:hypothetical protein FSP39_013243 [Pinctada imbricata]
MLGILGNFAAILMLYFSRKRHKWRPFHRLVLCLAVTDFCGIMFVYPLVMYRYSSNFNYDFPEPLCHYYISFIFTYAPLSSAFIICAMSIDRFIAILFPHSYGGPWKYKRVNLMLITQALAAFIFAGLHLVGLGDANAFYPGSWCFFNFTGDDIYNRANSYIYSVVGILTVAIMITLNSIVMVKICRRTGCRKLMEGGRSEDKANIKIIVFLIAVVVIFTVLWLPLMVDILLHAAIYLEGQGDLELDLLRLAVTNAIVDPWIYIFLRRETLEFVQNLYWKIRAKFGGGLTRRNSDRQSLSNNQQQQTRGNDNAEASNPV